VRIHIRSHAVVHIRNSELVMVCDILQQTAHCNKQHTATNSTLQHTRGGQRACSHRCVCCWYLLLCCLRYTLQHAATQWREMEHVLTSVRVRTCACVYLLLCFLGHALQHTATHEGGKQRIFTWVAVRICACLCVCAVSFPETYTTTL